MAPDEWTTTGDRITDDAILRRLRTLIDDESAIIVEHRHYRGSRAPTRLVYDDADAFEAYVRENGRPGDSFYIWAFETCCRDDNTVANGKIPDEEGRTPVGGAY